MNLEFLNRPRESLSVSDSLETQDPSPFSLPPVGQTRSLKWEASVCRRRGGSP